MIPARSDYLGRCQGQGQAALVISDLHIADATAGGDDFLDDHLHGLMLMMKSIAQEVAPFRIRVNSICPAPSARRSIANVAGRKRPSRALSKLPPRRGVSLP